MAEDVRWEKYLRLSWVEWAKVGNKARQSKNRRLQKTNPAPDAAILILTSEKNEKIDLVKRIIRDLHHSTRTCLS